MEMSCDRDSFHFQKKMLQPSNYLLKLNKMSQSKYYGKLQQIT